MKFIFSVRKLRSISLRVLFLVAVCLVIMIITIFCIKFSTRPSDIQFTSSLQQSEPVAVKPIPENYYPYSDFSESLKHAGRQFYESIKPGFVCPNHLLKRTGKKGDGGKWTCGLETLSVKSHCVVYSFGVDADSSFESEVMASTPCEIYAYDPKVDQIPLGSSNSRVHFEKIGIAARGYKDAYDRKYITLKDLMKRNGDHKWIDIVKMDVEGDEYAVLNKISRDFPEGIPIGQLLVEVHTSNFFQKTSWILAGSENKTNIEGEGLVKLFRGLEQRGLRIFHYEMNPAFPHTGCEFSLINVKHLHIPV